MEVLNDIAARADRAGVFLDFDGTLSEIAEEPEAATAVAGAAEILERLARRFRIVAIVTGRRVAEVERRLEAPRGVRFFGLYGLERGYEVDEPGRPETSPASRDVEEVLPRVMEIAAGIPGALVEPKGSNVAVHYRRSADPEGVRSRLMAELEPLATQQGMRLVEGKRVIELVPSVSPSKGDLVEREAQGLEAVLYAGDDLADLEAFAAVDRLAESGARTLKVAVRSAETPQVLVGAADVSVEGPSGLLAMLAKLAG